MFVGVPVERSSGERRVALVPGVVPVLARVGVEVLVEAGAGEEAGFSDEAYQGQGARTVQDRGRLFAESDVLAVLRGPNAVSRPGSSDGDIGRLRPGQVLVGLLNPLGAPQATRALAEKGVTAFALELLPRISRAQSMDALTSMATVAGYKAVLMAAEALSKMFPMMITAAGTITPARVFVVGAGVAGLQAIATARRLGAVVEAYDLRPVVKEQVESLGAKFVEMGLQTQEAEGVGGYARAMGEEFYQRQREVMSRVVSESDVVITTAAVPGAKAPLLITEEMVQRMRPGAVIVDLAAEGGGNCQLTKAGETVEAHGVTIMGPVNLPTTVPYHASQMYARNVTAFLQTLVKDGSLRLNLEDPILGESLLTHQGEVVNARVREMLGLAARLGPASEKRSV